MAVGNATIANVTGVSNVTVANYVTAANNVTVAYKATVANNVTVANKATVANNVTGNRRQNRPNVVPLLEGLFVSLIFQATSKLETRSNTCQPPSTHIACITSAP